MSCKICKSLVISTAVSWTGSALTVTLPAGSYADGACYCVVVAQSIPAAVTVDAPVVLLIGEGAEQYPLQTCAGRPVTASRLHARTRYPVRVETTPTSAVFRLRGRISACGNNNLPAVSG